MSKTEKITTWFAVGFVASILFWAWIGSTLGPHEIHPPSSTPLSSMPGYIRSYVCGWGNYPVSVVQTEGGYSSLYNVTCSNGDVVGTSW